MKMMKSQNFLLSSHCASVRRSLWVKEEEGEYFHSQLSASLNQLLLSFKTCFLLSKCEPNTTGKKEEIKIPPLTWIRLEEREEIYREIFLPLGKEIIHDIILWKGHL